MELPLIEHQAKRKINWLIITKVIAGLFILFAFYQNCRNNFDPDLGWHLRIGGQILETRSIPQYDNLSFTMPGYSWVDHEWLIDALLAYANNTDSWQFVIIISTLIAFAPFLWWLKRSTEIIETIPLLITALALKEFITIRPQLISFLFFFLVLQIISTLESKNRSLFSGYYRFIFPLLFFIWANLHAGFFSGLILISVYIIAQLIHSRFFQKIPYKNFAKDAVCLGLCALTPLINPYGLRLYQEIFTVSTDYQTLHHIQEWSPLFASFNLPFIFFIGIFISALALSPKKYLSSTLLLIPLFFLITSMKAMRMFPFFAITAVPIATTGLRYFIQNLKKTKYYSQRKQVFIRFLFFCIIFLSLSTQLLAMSNDEDALSNSYLSPRTVEFLKNYRQEHNDIRMFNEYDWGGYLSFVVPEFKLFIDGRMPHWKGNPHSAMEDYTQTMFGNNWQEVFARREINLVLIKNDYIPNKSFFQKTLDRFMFFKTDTSSKKNPLKENLLHNNWNILYEDSSSTILSE